MKAEKDRGLLNREPVLRTFEDLQQVINDYVQNIPDKYAIPARELQGNLRNRPGV
jgi:hypothetical protein